MRRAVLVAAFLLSGCAVKGYDLGWAVEDRLTPHLGRPLDGLGDCRWRSGEAVPAACGGLVAELKAMAAGLPPVIEAPAALGARCTADRCAYANRWLRRDIGTALIVPVFRKIVLREVRVRFGRKAAGWQLEAVQISDNPPPGYGPVRIGG